MEVEDDDGLSLPPIHVDPPIIRAQPTSNQASRHQATMETTSTNDWISMLPRRFGFGLSSQRHFLSQADQVEIQQVVELSSRKRPPSNFMGKRQNGAAQYRVKVDNGDTTFLAVEDHTANNSRWWTLTSWSCRELRLSLMDLSGETALVVRKTLGCACLPGFLHKVQVESSERRLGSVEQNFTLLGVSFTVYDEARQALCHIDGPSIYSCCMSTETQFQIVSVDRSRQMASLIRHWNDVLVDYSILLTYTPDTEAKLKSLLLGAAFLLEFLYFERR